MNPSIAVLMCAHNSEPFISAAIESILAQTFADFEFIIVENGSTDKTWDIIKSYNDPRIRTYKTDLKQLIFNLNYGLLQTKAEFIARMDSDDISKPERLESQIAYLKKYPDTTVLGSAFETFGDGIPRKIVTLPTTDKAIRRRLPFLFSICHPTVIFSRKTILEHGGYIGPEHSQDFYLWLKLSRDKTVKFANLPEVLLKYRYHPSQVKGSKEAYSEVACALLKEAIMRNSPYFFGAFLFSCFKIFRATK
jgi:O86/O127-antigen biosynthesis beta-1,3-galactosyltransferase